MVGLLYVASQYPTSDGKTVSSSTSPHPNPIRPRPFLLLLFDVIAFGLERKCVHKLQSNISHSLFFVFVVLLDAPLPLPLLDTGA